MIVAVQALAPFMTSLNEEGFARLRAAFGVKAAEVLEAGFHEKEEKIFKPLLSSRSAREFATKFAGLLETYARIHLGSTQTFLAAIGIENLGAWIDKALALFAEEDVRDHLERAFTADALAGFETHWRLLMKSNARILKAGKAIDSRPIGDLNAWLELVMRSMLFGELAIYHASHLESAHQTMADLALAAFGATAQLARQAAERLAPRPSRERFPVFEDVPELAEEDRSLADVGIDDWLRSLERIESTGAPA